MLEVAAAIVTFERQAALTTLLNGVEAQTVTAHCCVVDAGPTAATVPPGATHIRSAVNLGGAGGFSLAILSALASGAGWIWILDDDACPVGETCLADLLAAAERLKLDAVSPLIVVPDDATRLAFPFRLAGRLSYDRAAVERLGFIPGVAQFFNGALIRREVFFRVGLPDMKLFVRGDEVDFMLRLRRAGVAFGTVTNVAVSHPSGQAEVATIVKDRIVALIPETVSKRYYFFRNRGYLARRYRRVVSLAFDAVFYPYAFIVVHNRDFGALRAWARAFWHGLSYRFGETPHAD